jgi:hypothetical protein
MDPEKLAFENEEELGWLAIIIGAPVK